MSLDASVPATIDRDVGDVTDRELRPAPEPVAHGAGVANHLDDRAGPGDSLYDRAIAYWRENVGDPDNEPWVAVEEFDADWLPPGEFVLTVTSSRWKAGTGEGDDYTAWHDQHISLREVVGDELRKPPLALHVEIMPQADELVYSDGNELDLPYGEGTRVTGRTTWAGSGEAIEARVYDALRAVYGDDALPLDVDGTPVDRVDDARRLLKGEAHLRIARSVKGRLVETIEHSKSLIDWGGGAELDVHGRRTSHGWLESKLISDRWELLGFDEREFSTELKIYQTQDWHKRPESDPFAHPKIEASFSGVDRGRLPHVDEFDDVLDHLRAVVSTHCAWADVGREHLVADDYFDGPACPEYEYEHPTGRREMLKERYEEVATDVYREALKDATAAPYDLLRVIAEESGATYDTLVERTGLARSTVRYHIRRMAEEGVVARVGNPVVVVFVSSRVLDRAREVIRRARPGESNADIRERAQERQEAREEAQEENDAGENTREGEEARTGDTGGPDGLPPTFRLLGDVDGFDAIDVAYAVTRDGTLDEHRDVAVRVDRLDRLR